MGILDQPFEVQRAVAEELLDSKSVRAMSLARQDWGFKNCASQNLVDAASSCESTLEFLEEVLGPVLRWISSEERFRKSGR
jgi:hypothetical protein